MGEIKSTLDLVMARTRHLKLSDADKQAQSRSQFEARLNGLLEKMFDQALRLEEFKRALAELGAAFDMDFRAPLIDVLLKKIVPGKDHAMILALLENPAGVDTSDLQLILNRFQEKLDTARSDHTTGIIQELADKNAISGSAVYPNLDRDERWNKTVAALMNQCNGFLANEKQKISSAIDS